MQTEIWHISKPKPRARVELFMRKNSRSAAYEW